MAINVYEYGRGGECLYMFRHTYAGIREMKMQMAKEDRHMSRVMFIHVWIHISRNWRNEDADAKNWAYRLCVHQ